jgi:hypothetical protein
MFAQESASVDPKHAVLGAQVDGRDSFVTPSMERDSARWAIQR